MSCASQGAAAYKTSCNRQSFKRSARCYWLSRSQGQRAIPADPRRPDLTSEDVCRQVIDRPVSEFGRIDILVNNAAHHMAQPGGIADITTEQFDQVTKTNLSGIKLSPVRSTSPECPFE